MLSRFSTGQNDAQAQEITVHVLTEPEQAKEALDGMGQCMALKLFAEQGEVLGLAVCACSKEVFWMPVGELTQEFLLESVRELIDAGRQIRTMDLKSQIKLLYPQGLEPERRVQFDDLEIMEYLLNPLKHEYVYEDLAKDYLNRMYPTRTDLLGKMTIKKAIADDGAKEVLHKWIGSLMATICDAYEPMTELL